MSNAGLTHTQGRPSRSAFAALLIALIGAPVSWAFHLFVSYVYVSAACAGWPMWGLHLITVIALGGIAVTAIACALIWTERLPRVDIRGSRYVAMFGLVLAIYFGFVILMHAWANFFTDPCLGLGLPVG